MPQVNNVEFIYLHNKPTILALGTSQNQLAPLVSEKLVELIRLKQSETRTDKTSFLNELGLEECDEENIYDGENPLEDCIDAEYELEEVSCILCFS